MEKLKLHLKTLLLALSVAALVAPAVPAIAAPSAPNGLGVTGSDKPTISWNAAAPSPTTGTEWNKISDAPFHTRSYAASVVFDGKLWVLGGDGPRSNDVWYSSDGINWTQATANAGWSARSAHAATVFDGKIWVLGGSTTTGDANDVWYSSDGINWTQATANANWVPMSYHVALSFQNNIWIVTNSEVWSSPDGINWTKTADSSAWSSGIGSGLAAVVFDEKMWILGGYNAGNYSAVWSSSDGIIWNEMTNNAAWSSRSDLRATVHEGKIWISGGYDGISVSGIAEDVWYSSDGANWTLAVDSTGWGDRVAHEFLSFKGRLWVIAGAVGMNWDNSNDVWSTPDLSISHYKLCWDKAENGCTNSVKVSPDGNIIASNDSALSKFKQTFLPTALAATNQVSYTFTDPLEPGTWFFSVYSVDGDGNQSVLAATTSAEITPGLPDSGYIRLLPYIVVLMAFVIGVVALTSRRTQKA